MAEKRRNTRNKSKADDTTQDAYRQKRCWPDDCFKSVTGQFQVGRLERFLKGLGGVPPTTPTTL